MAVEIIRVIRVQTTCGRAPAYLVRCTSCGSEYARTGFPSDIKSADSCSDCANKRRAKHKDLAQLSPKERKRLQNQRYWANRKLRLAAVE